MFTTPCFIRKNTPELRKKLERLGYYPHPTANLTDYPVSQALYTGRGFYGIIPIGYSEETDRIINCEENESLFLAIAALRDDTDENQWFTNGNTWFKCQYESIEQHREEAKNNNYHGAWIYDCHKASVEELIKHFNHG